MLKQVIAAGAIALSSQAMAEPTQAFVDTVANGDHNIAVLRAAETPVQSQSGTMATLGLGLLSVVALRSRRKRYAN